MCRSDSGRWLAGLCLLLASAVSVATPAPDAAPAGAEAELPPCAVSLTDPVDYRTAAAPDSPPVQKGRLNLINTYHYWPAMQGINRGEYSESVMENLDFTLRHWPNHLPALHALIVYALAGGKPYKFDPASCYLQRAHQFVPDDPGVLLAEGYFFWKRKLHARAMEAYQAALAVDPNSPDAHYDLGLLYCEAGQYDKAVVQARAAYGAGYPLPGLKNKLQQAGHWAEVKLQ